MTPPTTTETNLYSTSDETSVDTEESYPVGVKSGTSNTSMTITLAARTWSRPSGSSNVKKMSSATENKTPVVCLRTISVEFDTCIAMHVMRKFGATQYQDWMSIIIEIARAVICQTDVINTVP